VSDAGKAGPGLVLAGVGVVAALGALGLMLRDDAATSSSLPEAPPAPTQAAATAARPTVDAPRTKGADAPDATPLPDVGAPQQAPSPEALAQLEALRPFDDADAGPFAVRDFDGSASAQLHAVLDNATKAVVMERKDTAVALFEEAALLDPASPTAHQRLCALYPTLNSPAGRAADLDRALKHCEAFLALESKDDQRAIIQEKVDLIRKLRRELEAP
jgi:hypothetical protein